MQVNPVRLPAPPFAPRAFPGAGGAALRLVVKGRIAGASGRPGGRPGGKGRSSRAKCASFLTGLMVGIGTMHANGSTSGHGVRATSPLSVRGIAATPLCLLGGSPAGGRAVGARQPVHGPFLAAMTAGMVATPASRARMVRPAAM